MAGERSGGHEMPLCAREQEVVRALAYGDLSEHLRAHIDVCTACHEVRTVAQQLHRLAEDVAEEPLRSAACTWWSLNYKMRREKVGHAVLPLVWMSRISSGTILFAAAFGISRLSIHSAVSSVLAVGLLALAAVALPIAIVLWRWSRS
jgi:hypothetical protein